MEKILPEIIKCEKHEFEKDLYCIDCKTLICKACLTEHSKKKHCAIYINDYAKDAVKQQINELQETIANTSVESNKEKLRIQIETLILDLNKLKAFIQ